MRRISTGYFIVSLVDFREVSLTEKVSETEDVILDFFTGGLVLACVHFCFEAFIRGIENLNVLLYFV
jgi:hypothetical protein